MKYRGGKSLPPSVAGWLEQQLEDRGIDSTLYSRYLLSLIQEESQNPNSNKSAKKNNNLKCCKLEEVNTTSVAPVVDSLPDIFDQKLEIESLVDELCRKLKEVGAGNCLKEKTNSEDLFNLELPVCSPNISKYHQSSSENNFQERSGWAKNICRALRLRREPESSPKEKKISKRKEGKENARGRMRSRSTVKSQSSSRSRSGMAKSLDRSEKSRRCLFGSIGFGGGCVSGAGKEEKEIGAREEEFENLPMDFQSLLQSPEDTSQHDFMRNKTSQQLQSGNFIQCGTNITSSIWSSEKMEEEETLPWEEPGKYVGWSDARNSLLSSAWKLPFAYGTLNNNNTNLNNNFGKKEDVEGTTLNLKSEGAFFSLFNNNSNHLSLMKATILNDKTESEKVEPPEQLENLLTSMKTHFKPIKQESVEVNANSYNDGSSFFNVSSFEEVKYRRSESGSLFLGPDQKYMEFKRTDLSKTPEFVPKFKVCSNEKFCQTDDLPPEEENASIEQNSDSEFFFPGDEHYAEEMNDAECPRIEVSGWVTTWPATSSGEAIWSNDSHQPWVIGENESWGRVESDSGEQENYTRLRHEITQEGEQLLSDLRSLLQEHRPQNVLLVGSSGL